MASYTYCSSSNAALGDLSFVCISSGVSIGEGNTGPTPERISHVNPRATKYCKNIQYKRTATFYN